jgi:hypothetical protein
MFVYQDINKGDSGLLPTDSSGGGLLKREGDINPPGDAIQEIRIIRLITAGNLGDDDDFDDPSNPKRNNVIIPHLDGTPHDSHDIIGANRPLIVDAITIVKPVENSSGQGGDDGNGPDQKYPSVPCDLSSWSAQPSNSPDGIVIVVTEPETLTGDVSDSGVVNDSEDKGSPTATDTEQKENDVAAPAGEPATVDTPRPETKEGQNTGNNDIDLAKRQLYLPYDVPIAGPETIIGAQNGTPNGVDEGSGLLTGEFFADKKQHDESDKWKHRFSVIKSFESHAEMEMINRLRGLYAANDRDGVDRILHRFKILAKYRYDQIHQSGVHNFSRPKEHPPFMKFAEYFGIRTKMDDKSIVGEMGCGFGVVADYFAKEFGSRVYAIDVSKYAIDAAIDEVKDKPYKDRIVFSVEDFQEALDKHRVPVNPLQFPDFGNQYISIPRFTHVFSQSSYHYNIPWNLIRLLNSTCDSIEPGGYFGLALKTNKSDSAKSEKHNPIYKGEDMSVFIDKTDKILRTYFDEMKIVELIRSSTHFKMLDMGIQTVPGYDVDTDKEELRTFVLQKDLDLPYSKSIFR